MEPPAAAWSLLSLPDRLRLPQSLYFGWLLLWGHLRRDEKDFDPFFTPKMRKMEHGSHSSWSRWSTGNATTGGYVEPRFPTRSFETALKPVLWLAVALGSSCKGRK